VAAKARRLQLVTARSQARAALTKPQARAHVPPEWFLLAAALTPELKTLITQIMRRLIGKG